jgi:hypothetical protein
MILEWVNREADQSRNKKFVKARLAALKIQEEMLAKQRFELEKKQKKIMDNIKIWMNRILPLLKQSDPLVDSRTILLSSSFVHELCQRGIPTNIRGKVWPELIGNHLNVRIDNISMFFFFDNMYRLQMSYLRLFVPL